MKRRLTRWLMPLLRYGLCAAAIVYIVQIVSWYDHVRLNDPAKSRVRLLEEHDDRLVIERDGQPQTITWDEINREDDVPDIKYGIRDVVHRMDSGMGLLAILLFFPVPIVNVVESADGIELSYTGNFFNFALPGFFGGDLIKA